MEITSQTSQEFIPLNPQNNVEYSLENTKQKKHIHFDLSQNETHIFHSDIPPSLGEHFNTINLMSITIITSLLFFTNAAHAYYRKYWTYAFLFAFLGITSLLYRYYGRNIYVYTIDQVAIYMVVLYGGFMLYKNREVISKQYLALISSTFLAVLSYYYYGKRIDNYCFHPDVCIAENYHGLVHCISSFGHHLIMAI